MILTDPYFKRYFDVFLFENLPANKRHPKNLYLGMVKRCDIYLGIFGRTYGNTDASGMSPTEREFELATKLAKDRIIFVKHLPKGRRRAAKMAALIRKAGKSVKYSDFRNADELNTEVVRSLLYWQEQTSKGRRWPKSK
jgi:hypothetical protein